MALVLNINDKKIKVPVSWYELTVAQYQRMKAVPKQDDAIEYLVRIFSAIVGVDYEIIKDDTSKDVELYLYQVMGVFINTIEPFEVDEVPDSVELGGYAFTIPKKIERLSVEQNLRVRQRIDRATVLEECISTAIAAYLCPQLAADKKFHVELMENLEAEILQIPVYRVHNLGFFLLNRLNNSGLLGQNAWLLTVYLKLTNLFNGSGIMRN